MNRHSSSANPTVSGHDHVSFFTSKNNFLKISPKEYHIFRGNYAYQPDWKEKNALPSSYKKLKIPEIRLPADSGIL